MRRLNIETSKTIQSKKFKNLSSKKEYNLNIIVIKTINNMISYLYTLITSIILLGKRLKPQ